MTAVGRLHVPLLVASRLRVGLLAAFVAFIVYSAHGWRRLV